MKLLISIIVPSHNSEKTIEKNIKSLLKQDYKGKYEIIVVDKSTDRTPEIVSKFSKISKSVKLIKQKSKGISAARNLGVKKSKGEIVAFVDSDCIAPKNWLKNLLKPFSDKTIVAVSGTYRVKNKESIIARFAQYEIEQRHKRMERFDEINFVGGFNCAYRKNIFLKFGGFDVNLVQSEDGELSYKVSKAGHKIKFNPSAYVYHYHPDSLPKFLRQKFWHAYWRVFAYKKHKDRMFGDSYTSKYLFTEQALIGIISLLLFLTLFNIIHLFYSMVFLSLYLLLILPLFFRIFVKDKTVGILSPFIIILRDFITGLGIVFGLISSKQKKFGSRSR